MSTEGDRFGLPRGIGQRDYGAMSSTAGSSTGATLGGFSPTEFISLSESIAANTIMVKQSWQFLEKVNRLIGSAKDNQSLRDKINDNQSGTNQRITMTTRDLQRLTTVVRSGDKQQKLQVEKLTSDFKNMVQAYSKSQQSIAAKMKQVLLVNASQADDQASGAGDGGMGDSSSELLQQQQQMQIQQSLQFEQQMLLEREQRVREIEANVLDVNHIMRELSSLTNQQGEAIEVEQAYATSQQNIADKMKRVLPVNEIMEVQASDDGGNNTDDSRSELLQIQINRDLHLEHKRLVEREQEILDIETTVVDVNHIMRDLSNLVNHQSEGIDSIENSITVAAENVEKGTDELGASCNSFSKTEFTSLSAMITANTLQVKPSCKYLEKRCITVQETEQNLLANIHQAEDPDTGAVCGEIDDSISDVAQTRRLSSDIGGDQQLLVSELSSIPPDTIGTPGLDSVDCSRFIRLIIRCPIFTHHSYHRCGG
uniref:t-SNARE coiled-coil homology domain-containing protein n=1 Tax=Anopheles albimanus TaxID=7167 RepID=A0A182FKP8_ANOAL